MASLRTHCHCQGDLGHDGAAQCFEVDRRRAQELLRSSLPTQYLRQVDLGHDSASAVQLLVLGEVGGEAGSS